MRLFFELTVCLVALVTTTRAVGQNAPKGKVEIVVRGPDGQPLRRRTIEVLSAERSHSQTAPPAKKSETDEHGKAKFAWPAGPHRLRVVVPGIGYGATGWFDVRQDSVASPALPRLLPFGQIEGDIPKAALRPNTYLQMKLDNFFINNDAERKIPCDEQGHFVINDVPCGGQWFRPRNASGRLGIETYVFMQPGQRRSYLSFRPDLTDYDHAIGRPEYRSLHSTPASATGTVRDEQGGPIADADVFVLGRYQGAIRRYEVVLATRSDKQGRWKIVSPESRSLFTGSIIAHKLGYCFSVAPVTGRKAKAGKAGGADAVPEYDLVLSRRSGTLEVAVVRDGRPLPKAVVQVIGEHRPELYSPIYVGSSREPARAELAAIIEPVATTDEHGVAHFTDLPPDRYQVIATSGERDLLIEIRAGLPSLLPREVADYAVADGVAVQSDTTTQFSLAVYQQVYQSRFRLLQPDGKPRAEQSTGNESARLDQGGRASWAKLEGDGIAAVRVDRPGLWNLSFTYHEPPWQATSALPTPYYEAAGVVGCSLLLKSGNPTEVVARRVEPGSILVELEDVDGTPIPGYVLLDRYYDIWAPYAGSTDERGRIRFGGVQAWRHTVEAYAKTFVLPSIGFADDPFPEDKDLIGHKIFLDQRITTANDTAMPVEMRAVKVGYVRGFVRPPAGRSCADYAPAYRFEPHMPDDRYDRTTGEFVCGPFPVGKTGIKVNRVDGASSTVCVDQEVEVFHDRVTRVELRPPADPEPGNSKSGPQPTSMMTIGMGGASLFSTRNGPRGTVMMSDGRTPAFGAHVYAFFPPIWPPTGHGVTDAKGRFQVEGIEYSMNEHGPDPPESPTEPLLMALLPGTCGVATVGLKPGEKTTITLPPAISARGRIMVANKRVAGRKCQFRVYAGYQGRGTLNGYFSIDTSADAFGNFELKGLTPGAYIVQATMDGIWLSPGVKINIRAEVLEVPPLVLDIGEPGVPSIVKCVRADGTPAVGIQATIARLAGPLADQLWPGRLVADGAGNLLVPPLEVGNHELRLDGQATGSVLSIPPVREGAAVSNRLTIKLE